MSHLQNCNSESLETIPSDAYNVTMYLLYTKSLESIAARVLSAFFRF